MTHQQQDGASPRLPRPTKPLIVGMDIATSTGVAFGEATANHPFTRTWDSRRGGKTRPQRLGMLGDQCFEFFNELHPDMLFYEQGLTLAAAYEIGTSEETFAFLRGAIGVVEAVAAKCKVPFIKAVSVQDARRHLLGPGKIAKGEGKKLVFERCKALRWPATNLDESDACAIWSLGCGEANPLSSAGVTPLFSGAMR